MTAATKPFPAVLNLEWGTCIEESLREVFSMMLHTEVKKCSASTARPSPELTALVAFSGSLNALFTIGCSQTTAATLATRMLEPDGVENEVQVFDALGEICNIVAGGFKARLGSVSDTCALSIPTVISGKDYELHPPSMGQFLELLLQSGDSLLSLTLHVTE